ncbi:MAG: archease [Bacteroidetes bacterium]|nr:archease [Bacteroidota bacterium]
MKHSFVILDHPADLGIEATGRSLSEAFENAAAGLMSVILDPETVAASESRTIALDGTDREHLLVKWLSEILYLYDGERFAATEFSVMDLGGTSLKATIRGEPFVPGRHISRMDVKAVTYHQLSVEEEPGGGQRESVPGHLDNQFSCHRMFKKVDRYRYVIPSSYKAGMRIEGMVYADEHLLRQIEADKTKDQVANVATLPGLVGRSLAMPDAHQGYGFCIGGVAAADLDEGIVSAGGVGFDINCGVRLLATPVDASDVSDKIGPLLDRLFRDIPCGTGRKGLLQVSKGDMDDVLRDGALWAVRSGYGNEEDTARIEEYGRLRGADPSLVSRRAKERGHHQLGTLGSGNHFLEIQKVSELYDEDVARAFGVYHGQIVILIHSGSRGLGHQVCTDFLEIMHSGMRKHGISVVDRQLACVPIRSTEGSQYLKAMAAAANFAFANRQMMTHWVRQAFQKIVGTNDVRIVYDVCHNIAKREEHNVNGVRKEVLVHRKGATRAFPRGHPALPDELRDVGQPVLIPGSMGTASYILVGTEQAMKETFGSSCHGAGRAKSRTRARKETSADQLMRQMQEKGILVRGESRSGLAEEKPDAYKDVSRVVDVVHGAGIARKVARLVPLAVMKG